MWYISSIERRSGYGLNRGRGATVAVPCIEINMDVFKYVDVYIKLSNTDNNSVMYLDSIFFDAFIDKLNFIGPYGYFRVNDKIMRFVSIDKPSIDFLGHIERVEKLREGTQEFDFAIKLPIVVEFLDENRSVVDIGVGNGFYGVPLLALMFHCQDGWNGNYYYVNCGNSGYRVVFYNPVRVRGLIAKLATFRYNPIANYARSMLSDL